jgi:hypothetical protein
MKASGVGDVELGLANRTWQGSSSRVVVFGGVSLPTGSVNEKDDMPGFPNQTVDYVMQPGSGMNVGALRLTGNNATANFGDGATPIILGAVLTGNLNLTTTIAGLASTANLAYASRGSPPAGTCGGRLRAGSSESQVRCRACY